ncbi:MAG: chemotaxis-specific protein-glutamate methyltransferase CheB [bacterium]
MTKINSKIKVLVVDDLSSARAVIRKLLERDKMIEVVGEAADGYEAIKKAQEIKPDLITMDVRMTKMDGYKAVEEITSTDPIPIIMVTSSEENHADLLFKALDAGAVDLVPKPVYSSHNSETDSIELIRKVKTLSKVRLKKVKPSDTLADSPSYPLQKPFDPSINPEILVVAASSGGPNAFRQVLSRLDTKFTAPIIIVQHINSQFFHYFLNWVKASCQLTVKKAKDGEEIKNSTVYVAPSDSHLTVSGDRKINLDSSPPWHNLRPAANRLFCSAAKVYGERLVGVILTGMGNDGSEGAAEIKRQGGYMISQDEESSAVFGMPGSAIENGVIDFVLPLDLIGHQLNKIFMRKR